jgi:hypothetical protein
VNISRQNNVNVLRDISWIRRLSPLKLHVEGGFLLALFITRQRMNLRTGFRFP